MSVYKRISQSTQDEMAKIIYGFVKFCANDCGGCKIGVQDDAGCIRCIAEMLNKDSIRGIDEQHLSPKISIKRKFWKGVVYE